MQLRFCLCQPRLQRNCGPAAARRLSCLLGLFDVRQRSRQFGRCSCRALLAQPKRLGESHLGGTVAYALVQRIKLSEHRCLAAAVNGNDRRQQSYERVGKYALIAHQRYAHAKQFKRANRALRTLRTYLGRVARDMVRKTKGSARLKSVFARPLSLAFAVRDQRQNQRGQKIYSLHAPEVECIGKGKAHRPYEFGVKVSVATTLHHSRGGQFIAHVKALPGNPYDGHTLATVIPEIEAQIGANLSRIVADRGYRGHNAPPSHQFKVYISGQKRRVTAAIKRELRRRAAVEPCIGHLKAEHRMGRCHLAHAAGDAANAVLAAAGYNFRRLLAWLAILLRAWFAALIAAAVAITETRRDRLNRVLHGRLP